MPESTFVGPQEATDQLFHRGPLPQSDPIDQAPTTEAYEVDMDMVKKSIGEFSGSPEEAQELVNAYISGNLGELPTPKTYKSNANSYMYEGAADNDPIKNLEHIRKGFMPEEDKGHTSLTDYEALNTEEQWAKLEKSYIPSSGGATLAGIDPNYQPRRIGKEEQQKYINQHLSELRSNSQTYKLSTGKGFSEQAKHMVNKMVMTKQPPNQVQFSQLTKKEKANFWTYASGRNPKMSTEAWETLGEMGTTIAETSKDIFHSFKKTGESIVRSWGSVEDPEELWLRFNSKFKDRFDSDVDELSMEDRNEIESWLVKEIHDVPDMPGKSMVAEQDKYEAEVKAGQMMEHIDSMLQTGKEARDEKSLISKTRAVTREAFKKEGFKGLLLSSTEMIMDLGLVAASSAVAGPAGGMAYSSNRFYGDFEETLLDAGVDPQKARSTALAAMIPYVMIEQLQANQIFGKQVKGAFTKVISETGGGKIPQIIAKYGDNITAETFEEVAQELAMELGKLGSIEGYDSSQIAGNLIETGKQAFEGLILLGAGTSIKGVVQGDFIEQDISDTIEGTQEPLTRKEEEEAGLGNLRQEEYDAAEDKEAYLEEEGYNEKEREFIGATQDIKQEKIQEKTQELDELEQSELAEPIEGVESLRAMTQRFEPYADIVEEDGGLRITTDKGFDIAVKFNGDIGGDFGVSDPKVATINLSKKSGLPTFNHEFGHMIRDMGGINDTEWKSVVKIARESLGAEEVGKIIAKNKEGYEARGVEFTDDIKNHEIFANALEEWTLTGDIPADARGTLQKFLDVIKDMLAQYIGGSQSGAKVIADIQSGKILERKPSDRSTKKMKRAAKRRGEAKEDAKKQREADFIKSALTEEDANNAELISAIEALSKLEQLPDFVTEKLSTKERIDQATGITRPDENLQAEEFVTGDDIIESELPGDFFQDESEGAGISPEELYSFGETVQNPILKFIEDNGGIARTPEIEQEIKHRHDNMNATKRYVNKNGALDWDQMAALLSTEPSSPLFEKEVTKDDILDFIGQESESKFSFSPRSERDAAIVLANSIITGRAKTLAQRDQILNSYKIPLENQAEINSRAFEIAEQVEQELGQVKNTETIRAAIKKAEIKQFYDAQRKEILTTGIEQGELIAAARQRLKDDRKKAKEETKQTQKALSDMPAKVRSINDEAAMLNFVNTIVEDARKKVFPNKEPKNWQRDARVLGIVRESVKEASNHLMKNVAPGADKQRIRQQIKELSDKATYRGLRAASEKVLNKILTQAGKTTQKKVQADLKTTLGKYSSKPEAKKEAKKRNIDGQKHWFLYYGNQAMKKNLDDVQSDMKSIEADMERFAEGKNTGDDIRYEDAEIKYRAYMTFGALSKSDANIPDIVSALEYADEVIKDGKALVMKLLEAHNEKYAETSAALIDAVLKAKPFVNKIDKKSKLGELFDTFGTMNVNEQLEFVTQYGTDSDKKKLDKILFGNLTSKLQKKQRIALMNKMLAEEAANLGIKNVEKFARDRSKLNKAFRKYSDEGRTDMSRANLMQLYMTFRQPDVIKMATKVNNDGELINPSLYKRVQQIGEIRKELTAQEMQLADAMGDLLSTLLPDINKAYKSQYGINMKIQDENYWPLRVQSKSGGYASQMATVSEAPGFTIQRVSHSNDLDERADIFEVFSGHVSDAAHYIATIDSQLAIRSTMTNRNFREAIRHTFGSDTLTQVDASVVDMAIDRALTPDAKVIPIVDAVRSIMSTISIGYNPKSILVALTGAVNIITTHKGTIRAIKSIAKNPNEYKDDISFIWDSVVVQNRLIQGLNEQMRNARERSKGNVAIKAYQDLGFAPLSYTDAGLISLTGGAIYNEFKNSEAAAGLTQEEIEIQGLAIVDYAIQKAYQPTDSDILPATIRRGGSLTKALFQFKTEPMSKLGLWAKDKNEVKALYDKGDKIGAAKKAIKIVAGQHIVIPTAYWLAGEIMRFITGEETEDEEALKRLAVHILVGPFSGLLYVGTGLELMIKGLVGEKVFLGSSTPSDRVVNEVKFILDRATKDEDIDEKILKVIKQYNSAAKNTLKIIEK